MRVSLERESRAEGFRSEGFCGVVPQSLQSPLLPFDDALKHDDATGSTKMWLVTSLNPYFGPAQLHEHFKNVYGLPHKRLEKFLSFK